VSGFKFANGPIRTVIDFGCGVGGFLAAVADRGVLGIGFARNWRKLPFLETAAARGVLAMHMDFRNHVPMVTGAVDMVHCSWLMNILSTQDEIEAILMEWDRLVRPGGFIVQYGFRNSDRGVFESSLAIIRRTTRRMMWKQLHWETPTHTFTILVFIFQKPVQRPTLGAVE
jgi:SAM-dependent methyltransferase